MMNVKFFPIVLWIAFFSSCREQTKYSCDQFYYIYHRLLDTSISHYDTAQIATTLNKIIDQSPYCIDAYLARAEFRYKRNALSDAISDFKTVLRIDGNNIMALFEIGTIYQREEKEDSAIYYFQKARNLKSGKDGTITTLNSKLGGSAKYDVDADRLLFVQGISFYNKHLMKDALSNFDFCILHNYELDDSYMFRGSIKLEIGEMQEACDDFNQANNLGNEKAKIFIEQYCKSAKK